MSIDQLKELAGEMRRIQVRLDELDAEWKPLIKRLDEIRLKEIPDLMSEEGIRTASFVGIGRVQLTSDLYVSIVGPKDEAYGWLISNGYGGVVVDYVHPSTMKAITKEMLQNGKQPPEELFKVSPFMRASITKEKVQ